MLYAGSLARRGGKGLGLPPRAVSPARAVGMTMSYYIQIEGTVRRVCMDFQYYLCYEIITLGEKLHKLPHQAARCLRRPGRQGHDVCKC